MCDWDYEKSSYILIIGYREVEGMLGATSDSNIGEDGVGGTIQVPASHNCIVVSHIRLVYHNAYRPSPQPRCKIAASESNRFPPLQPLLSCLSPRFCSPFSIFGQK